MSEGMFGLPLLGAGLLVITCMIGFFTGLSVGTGMIVSQADSGSNADFHNKIRNKNAVF